MGEKVLRELIGAVEERIARSQRGDRDGLVGVSGAGQAHELASCADELGLRHEAAPTLARFWWERFRALPRGMGVEDLQAAARAARDCDPGALPRPVATLLQADPSGAAGPKEWTTQAWDRFDDLTEQVDIPGVQDARDLLWIAVHSTPPEDPRSARLAAALASVHHRLWTVTGGAEHLDAAIECWRSATAAGSAHDPGRMAAFGNLALSLRARFAARGNDADLDDAVDAGREALRAGPDAAGQPSAARAVCASGLAIALRQRFSGRADAADLDEAIDLGHQAMTLLDALDPDRTVVATNLAHALLLRHEVRDRAEDLDDAALAAREGASNPEGHNLRQAVEMLVEVALTRFNASSHGEDLDVAVDALRRLLRMQPPDERHGAYETQLAELLRTRFRTGQGDVDDVDEAIAIERQLLSSLDADDVTRSQRLAGLGLSLRMRFQASGDLGDIVDAVVVLAQSLAREGTGDAPSAAQRDRVRDQLVAFGRTGRAEELFATGLVDDATELADAAVRRPPPDLESLCLVGWLRWLRCTSLPRDDPSAAGEGQAAFDVLRPVMRVEPQAAPGPLLQAFSEEESAGEDDQRSEVAERHSALGVQVYAGYRTSGDVGLLRASVEHFRAAAEAAPRPTEQRAEVLNNLGMALLDLSQVTKASGAVDEAVAALRESVALSAPDEPYLPGRLSILCGALRAAAAAHQNEHLLAESVAVGRQAVAVTPVEHPSRGVHLSNLATALLAVKDDATVATEEAVRLLRKAVGVTPAGNRHRATCLANLGTALNTWTRLTRDVEVLRESIAIRRELLASTGEPVIRARVVDGLGDALADLFEQTGDRAALIESVDSARAAWRQTFGDDPALASRAGTLAVRLQQLAEGDDDRSGHSLEIVEVLRGFREAPVPGGPERAALLAMLGLTLPHVADRLGPAVWEEAVAVLREAVAAAGPDVAWRTHHRMSLAMALHDAFDATGRREALLEAIGVGREVLADTPAGDDERPDRRRLLIRLLSTLYEITHDQAAIDEAATLAGNAVAESPAPSEKLALAQVVFLRGHGPGVKDLGEAVALARRAVDDLSAEEAETAAVTANLGTMLLNLYSQTDAREHLAAAEEMTRRAVTGQGEQPWIARNLLANVLHLVFVRDRDGSALREALEMADAAVEEVPREFPFRSLYLATLGDLQHLVSDVDDDLPLLEEAVDSLHAAVLAAGDSTASRVGHQALHAQTLLRLYERTGAAHHLDEALRAARQSANEGVDSQPQRAEHLGIHARIAIAEYHRTGDRAVLQEARDSAARGLSLTAGSLDARVNCGERWGAAAMTSGSYDDAVDAYARTIELVVERAGPLLGRSDREFGLDRVSGLPSAAAAAAIAAGRPWLAVELLEQSRGVLLGELLATRTDLVDLERRAPELAAEYRRLAAELDGLDRSASGIGAADVPVDADGSVAGSWQTQFVSERRSVIVDQLARLREHVRTLPGLGDFLRRPSADSIRSGLGDAVVAVVNVSRWRSDALLVTRSGVQLLPLPDASLDETIARGNKYLGAVIARQEAEGRVAALRQRIALGDAGPEGFRRYDEAKLALLRSGSEMEDVLHETLEWLWDTVCGPVVDHLQEACAEADPGRRLWWCPTGPLTLLPLHAAGHHRPDAAPGRAVLDRVISSYTPTLRSLAEAASQEPTDAAQRLGRMVVVMMSRTPGQAPLPNAVRERECLRALVPADRLTVLENEAATRADVLDALERHDWAHFSCHGAQDLQQPSRGGLLVADGLITIRDIASQASYRGELAFLSACQTALGGVVLLDEASTLASALHHVGFRHVVATLWSVYDPAAAYVTERVYSLLADGGSIRPRHTAAALHHAVTELREANRDRPSVWMPFSHIGP